MNLRYSQRLFLIALAACGGAFGLFLRLFSLQVAEHDAWAKKAEAQVAVWRPVHARRGRLLDARGRELAVDEAGFELTVCAAAWEGRLYECRRCGFYRYFRPDQRPGRCPRCRREGTLAFADRRDVTQVARLLDLTPAELRERVEWRVAQARRAVARRVEEYPRKLRPQRRAMLWADHGWRQRRIARDVPYEVAREVELYPRRNPAFRIRTVHTRRVRGGAEFVHVVGTVSQRRLDLENPEGGVEKMDTPVGTGGLEGRFDRELSGRWGWVKVLRDPRTRATEVVARRSPVHGSDITLTIASEDQAQGAAALQGVAGALVVIDAETGAVLVAASSPVYEPGEYARTLAELQAVRERTGRWPRHHALQDSAFRDFHFPGSVMKPFTAVAALTGGVSDPSTRITCSRYFTNRRGQVIRSGFACDGTHDEMELHSALVRSCNIYFETLQKRMIQRELFPHFAATGGRFGFGQPTGIEIEPDPFPDTYRLGKRWGQWILSAIGQGDVKLSPAQIARAYAGLATGKLPRLHLVARVGDRETRLDPVPLGVPERVLVPIRAALFEVPRTGTASGHGLERWGVACKTGTAQRGSVSGRPDYNAWLAGFAPARAGRPAIAFAMVVLDTPFHGSQACGPRVAEFLRGFYGGTRE